MRNLPQTVESFKSNIHDHCCDDDSPYNTVCPRDWPMNDQKSLPSNYRGVARRSCSLSSTAVDNNRGNKFNQLCCYLAEHRTRLLLTFISLVFLSIFLVVIYRQFGWIAFISLLCIVAIPFILIFIYAKRMEYKDDEQQLPRNCRMDQINARSSSSIKRQQNDKTNELTVTTIKKPLIFNTEIEMENIANEQLNNRSITETKPSSSSSALKRNLRKSTTLNEHHHHNHKRQQQRRQKSIVLKLPETEIIQKP